MFTMEMRENIAVCFEKVDIKEELQETDDLKDNSVEQINYITDVKVEPQDINGYSCDVKAEPTTINCLLYCCKCQQEFEDFCLNCTMISHILDTKIPKGVESRTEKTVPKNVLEIKHSPINNKNGIFALKTIPSRVSFGPFEGSEAVESTTGYTWKMDEGKLKTGDNLNECNWMVRVNNAKSAEEKNLTVFQCDGNLYYRSYRQINKGEELLVWFGDDLQKIGNYYQPSREKMDDVFACAPCCLGFNSEEYLRRHQTKCIQYRMDVVMHNDGSSCSVCNSLSGHLKINGRECPEKLQRTLGRTELVINQTIKDCSTQKNGDKNWFPNKCCTDGSGTSINVLNASINKEQDHLELEFFSEKAEKSAQVSPKHSGTANTATHPPSNCEDTINGDKNDPSTCKRNRSKNFCYFCKVPVLNFARHLKRHHEDEAEVQKIVSLPVQSKERKELFTLLRKKGNYLNSGVVAKPVKTNDLHKNFLPCSHCLGFYSAKQLWRHHRRCARNINKQRGCRIDAQNFLVEHLNIDSQLRRTVFPHMRADDISLAAKKDALICAFGARYVKKHADKHIVAVTSRRMRHLAKLLVEMIKLEPSIENLMQALQPQNYDLMVMATKVVAKYNPDKGRFQSPSYVIDIGTAMKQCCEIALKQRDTCKNSEMVVGLNRTMELIESRWRHDVSGKAAGDLNVKKWAKLTVLSFAGDLKATREYLLAKACDATKRLITDNLDETAYNDLMETIYCRAFLLNKRHAEDLRRLQLHRYGHFIVDLRDNSQVAVEAITPAESVLMQKFKCLVIEEKQKFCVPVFFSDDIREDIRTLQNFRSNFLRENNFYLFCKASGDSPIPDGHRILEKHAKVSGAERPESITSCKLRKLAVTITQILNMSSDDIERVVGLMGLTVKPNASPNNLWRVAKISKLLLMGDGESSEHKGKALDDIRLDLEESLNDLVEETGGGVVASVLNDRQKKHRTRTRMKQKRKLVRWTKEQREIVEGFFRDHIVRKRAPKRKECEGLIRTYPERLENKNWLKIKVYIQNKYSKGKK